MKIHLLLIPMLLLACRTTAGTKEKPAVTKPYAAEAEVLIVKRIDALTKSQAQIYECKLTSSDVKDPEEVKKLIREVPRDKESMVTAMHFRATDPSIEYFARENGEDVLLLVDHSMLKFPGKKNDPGANNEVHGAAKKLMEIADQLCPGPKK